MNFKSMLFASILIPILIHASPIKAQRDYMSELAESCQQEQTLSQSEIDEGYYFSRSRMEGRWCITIKYNKFSSIYEPGRIIDVQSITAKTRLSDQEFLSVTGMWMFGISNSPRFSTLIHDFSLKTIPILGASITPYGHLENYSYGGNLRIAAPYLSTIRQGMGMIRQYPLPFRSAPF